MEELEQAFIDNPIEADAFNTLKQKRRKLVGFLMGQCLKANKSLDPVKLREALEKRLDQ